MDGQIFKSKVDWWIPVIVLVTVSVAFLGPIIDGEVFVIGILMGVILGIMEIVMFASVKYQICDGKLGVRNCFYKWEWFPIEKISEVRKTESIMSATALSAMRVSIRFSDRKILKSSMPLEISPKDRDGFIVRLKELNPDIVVKTF